MQIPEVVATSFDIVVNYVRSDRSDLNKTIMLYEYGVAVQIPMYNWWVTSCVKVTKMLSKIFSVQIDYTGNYVLHGFKLVPPNYHKYISYLSADKI